MFRETLAANSKFVGHGMSLLRRSTPNMFSNIEQRRMPIGESAAVSIDAAPDVGSFGSFRQYLYRILFGRWHYLESAAATPRPFAMDTDIIVGLAVTAHDRPVSSHRRV